MEKTEIELSISKHVLVLLFLVNLGWMGVITGIAYGEQLLYLPVLLIVFTSSIIVTGLIAAIIYYNHPKLRLDDKAIYTGETESKKLSIDEIDRIYTAPGGMKIVAGTQTLMITNFYRNYAKGRAMIEKKAGGRIVEMDRNSMIVVWGLILFVVVETVLLL